MYVPSNNNELCEKTKGLHTHGKKGLLRQCHPLQKAVTYIDKQNKNKRVDLSEALSLSSVSPSLHHILSLFSISISLYHAHF